MDSQIWSLSFCLSTGSLSRCLISAVRSPKPALSSGSPCRGFQKPLSSNSSLTTPGNRELVFLEFLAKSLSGFPLVQLGSWVPIAAGKGFCQDRPTGPDCSELEEGWKVSAVGTTGPGAGKGSFPSGDFECSHQGKAPGAGKAKTQCPLHQASDRRWGAPATQVLAASSGWSLCRCGSVKCT